MSLIKEICNIEKGLPIIGAPDLETAVHWTPSEKLPIHRWFRYREGFSPHLLDLFDGYKQRFDPFCGCGTTMLSSALHGYNSYGIDINPLATFVTRTKTKYYSRSDRDNFTEMGNKARTKYRSLKSAPMPRYELLEKLFLPQSLQTLLKLKTFINNVTNKKVQDLLLLAWLSILEKSSNVFKEGNGLKYRNKRRNPGKYITIPDEVWIPKYFGDNISSFVEGLWEEKILQITEDLTSSAIQKGHSANVRTGSCLDEKFLKFEQPIDLAIFSPPYANRFDYFEAFKIELWMGGFVRNGKDMSALRNMSIRNNLTAKKFVSDFKWDKLSPFLNYMDPSESSVRMGIKRTLEGYFYDMRMLLKMLSGVMAKKGKVVIVVGNSAYAKSIIPTDVLLAHIGQEEGYNIEAVKVARKLHVSSQQRSALSKTSYCMRESVVIMDKKK